MRALLSILVFAVSVAFGIAGDAESAKVRNLIRRMTLEEKLSLVRGARDPEELGQAGYWPGLQRLGIPPLRLADGPPGVNTNADATAMPAPVSLAATFSPESARRYGTALGREAKALGQQVLLAPHANIVRDPLFRRNHTAFSEDPLLSAELAAAEIRGIQSQGVMAQVKHLAGYNGSENVFIDERTLHEIYLPAFESAVNAGVASVMCAYNRVNGTPSCESAELLNDILRRRWGFGGFVASDWGALHSPFAILSGLDLEMPGRPVAGRPGPFFAEPLKNAVADDSIPVAELDRAVARILGQMERFHLLDGAGTAKRKPVDVAAGAADARRLATEGAVLLKNEASALPLTAEDLKSLVFIGPTAGQVAAGFMGERGYGFESRLVSPLDAFKRITGANVAYSVAVDLTGEPIPPSAFSHNGQPGLIRRSAEGEAPSEQVDLSMNFAGSRALPASSDFAWVGTLAAPEDGDYTLMLQPVLGGGSEGGGSITIDGAPVARTGGPGFGGSGMRAKKWSSLLPTTDGRDNGRGTVRLSAGPHRIEVIINSTDEGPLTIRLAWTTPAMRRKGIEQAIAAARGARAAVVFAWAPTSSSIMLPESQDELIEKVAAVNRKTVVVLNTGGPVLMPWRNKVQAILEMWYPGQEGGWATADLLTGREAPRGKLPVTFPARLEDAPARAPGHPERIDPPSEPGRTGMNPDAQPVVFSEGIFVGYRWYDQQGIEPLFPFGHGLSYSKFEYSGLAIARVRGGLRVSFTLRNTGLKPAYETPQVYAGPAQDAAVPMPPRSLVAFRRVRLGPGQSVRLNVMVAGRQLSYWSTELHGWKEAPGKRTICIGSSSRHCALSGIAGPP